MMQAYGTKIGFVHFAEAGAETRVTTTGNAGIANPAGRIHNILPDTTDQQPEPGYFWQICT
jgi:hypothetical protein